MQKDQGKPKQKKSARRHRKDRPRRRTNSKHHRRHSRDRVPYLATMAISAIALHSLLHGNLEHAIQTLELYTAFMAFVSK